MKKVRRKRCKSCNELFTPTYSTLQVACSPKCAIDYSKAKYEKEKTENAMILEKAMNQKKERQKLATLLNSVKTVCHEYIRQRDAGKPCISCGTPYHSDFQAGHYYKAELFSSLKFNEYNINGQCVQCNIRKEGNLNDYELNLPKRIGEKQFKILKAKASIDKKLNFKWNREALREIRNYYREKLKELKNDN